LSDERDSFLSDERGDLVVGHFDGCTFIPAHGSAFLSAGPSVSRVMPSLNMPVPPSFDRLLTRLDLEAGEPTSARPGQIWIGHAGQRSATQGSRIFGGLVCAQVIVAAGRHPQATAAGRQIHSVQQVFLRPGQVGTPLIHQVETLFEGRTYASLRVTVWQNDEIISHAQIGLSSADGGLRHMTPSPSVVRREDTVNRDELRGHENWNDQPITTLVTEESYHSLDAELASWMKAAGPVPDDPVMQRALMGYASDRTMMSVARKPHTDKGTVISVTLNHSIWFHDEIDMSQWHSYTLNSPMGAHGRAMIHGAFHREDGHHAATTAQEGVIRLAR